MIKKTVVAILVVVFMTGFASFQQEKPNEMNTEEKTEIKKLLFAYRDALNASSTDSVMLLYAESGVFMPSGAPTSIGTDQVRGAYDYVFTNIRLNIEFYIDEIEIIEDYAFVRSISKGTTQINATGETIPEENRELFVLKKEKGLWKIDRYMFNKMK